MLHTAVIPVDIHPVFQLVHVGKCCIVLRIDVAQIIPGRACPLRHRVRLTLGSAAALRASAVHEAVDLGKRGLTVLTGHELFDFRKPQRKLLIRNAYHTAVRAMDDRYRLAPVSLTVESPILHLILNACFADSLLLKVLDHAFNGILLICIAVQEVGVDHLAVACIGFNAHISALDDFDDVEAERLCKIIVALVVTRYSHDCTRAVTHHDIVCYEQRDLLAVDRIDCLETFDADTCLVLYKVDALELALLLALIAVSLDCIHVRDLIGICIDERMLRCNDHKGDAEKRIRSGRVDTEFFIHTVNREVHKCTLGLSDPVLLLHADCFREVDCVKALQKFVGILCDAKIPDFLLFLDDFAAADIALTVLAVLIGENNFAGRAIVNERLIAVSEIILKEFQEDPLCPFVIILISRIDHTAPVKGEADAFQLLGEMLDVLIRDDTRMCIGLDRIVLSRKTECVETDREEDIVALHTALAGNDFKA